MSGARHVDEEELEGRTIQKLVRSGSSLLLVFADGTYTKIRLDWFAVYCSGERPRIGFEELDKEDLAALGVA